MPHAKNRGAHELSPYPHPAISHTARAWIWAQLVRPCGIICTMFLLSVAKDITEVHCKITAVSHLPNISITMPTLCCHCSYAIN